jgi:hypothetical protein
MAKNILERNPEGRRNVEDVKNDFREMKVKKWRQNGNNKGKVGVCLKEGQGS